MSSQLIETRQPFSLQAFDGESSDGKSSEIVEITGEIARQGSHLQVFYKLVGDVMSLQLPGLAAMPLRRDELWQQTCFEFFLGIPGESGYWEFNLSPSGDWNIYRLSDYRENLTPELAFGALPFNVIVTESVCILSLDLDLSKIVSADQAIEVGITAVVEKKPEANEEVGDISYWAIAHTGPEADFHRRDSFVIQLPAA